jgi:hypothetical protein
METYILPKAAFPVGVERAPKLFIDGLETTTDGKQSL